MQPYRPQPIDVSGVKIPEKLLPLVEKLAEHVHDVWAAGRLAEGWTWGEFRDDAAKKHPDLIPYAQLSEGEKNYDRQTALGTLQAVLALGGRLLLEQVKAPVAEGGPGPWLPATLLRDPAELRKLWENRPGENYFADDAALLAQQMLRVAEPLLAYDLLAEARLRFPDHLRLAQLMALALDRCGDPVRACVLLESLRQAGHRDGETLGLLARTHKARALRAKDAPATQSLEKSHALYAGAFKEARAVGRRGEAFYNGINTASTALMKGDAAKARDLAREVLAVCRGGPGENEPDYWLQATMGEAMLLAGDLAGAEVKFAKAGELAAGRWADLASTRKQVRQVLQRLDHDPELIEGWLPVPPVLVYSGHMIDAPGRRVSRFPVENENSIAGEIGKVLDRLKPAQVFGAAASGTDLLVAEAAVSREIPVHLVLPFSPGDFRKLSVEGAGGDWSQRFDHVLAKAASLSIATDHCPDRLRGVLEYTNRLQLGMAMLQADRMDTAVRGLAVWDGEPGDGAGGTASAIAAWKERQVPVDVINVKNNRSPAAALAATPPQPGDQPTRAILFADVAGFSKLDEKQLESFARHYLGGIAAQADRSAHAPLLRNTWGDGLFFVFESVRAAGCFALELREALQAIDLQAVSLPTTLATRIALHAGPVYQMTDPVTGRPNFLGTHVSRAARIEPVTPPGQVYASAAFAALARVEAAGDFACDYVGQIPLAKQYGRYAVYHVRPVRE